MASISKKNRNRLQPLRMLGMRFIQLLNTFRSSRCSTILVLFMESFGLILKHKLSSLLFTEFYCHQTGMPSENPAQQSWELETSLYLCAIFWCIAFSHYLETFLELKKISNEKASRIAAIIEDVLKKQFAISVEFF